MEIPHNMEQDSSGHRIRESETRRERMNKKPNGEAQGASNVTIALTQSVEDISKILSDQTGMKRARVLWLLLIRGLGLWVKDGLLQDPAYPSATILQDAVKRITTDPQYEPSIARLKIAIEDRTPERRDGDTFPPEDS